jgi:hypothetical protein
MFNKLILLLKKKALSIPTVSAPTAVNYTLSVSTDPLNGPFNSTFNTTAGIKFQLRLSQLTAGPQTNFTVSFGDGITFSNLTLNVETNLTFSYTYMTPGTFKIFATPIVNASYTVINNNITVNAAIPPVYTSKICFKS